MSLPALRDFVARVVPPGLSFKDPLLLLLLLLVPVAIALKILRERRGDGALIVPTLAPVARVAPSWRVRLRHLPLALALIGYAGLVVALARPRLGLERTESWTEGVDIFIALDASGSMAAEDFKPKNRFHVAKACTRQFIEGRPSDRVGLLVFAGRSRTVSPLTTDRSMVLDRLASLKLGDQGDGTAIGMALGNALARLRPSKAKSRVVVLVTDGGNNAGEIDPDTAAGVAKALGVRVYTVGVGTNNGPVEIPDPGAGSRDGPGRGAAHPRERGRGRGAPPAHREADRSALTSARRTPQGSRTPSRRSTGSRRPRSRRRVTRDSGRSFPTSRGPAAICLVLSALGAFLLFPVAPR